MLYRNQSVEDIMPQRTLPWVTGASKKPTRSSRPPSPRYVPLDDNRLVDDDLNIIRHSPRPQQKHGSVCSQSESPEPMPPNVEFMREGYGADDQHMMVEDEFLTTAKLFTKHVHHAEYVRLQGLARARGTTASSARRGTDGTTKQSAEVKLRIEATAKKADIKAVIGNGPSESDEEDEYMQDPLLAGLMSKERSSGRDLTAIRQAKEKVRMPIVPSKPRKVDAQECTLSRSAGFVSESSNRHSAAEVLTATETSETDADDLDDDLDDIRFGSVKIHRNTRSTAPQDGAPTTVNLDNGMSRQNSPSQSSWNGPSGQSCERIDRSGTPYRKYSVLETHRPQLSAGGRAQDGKDINSRHSATTREEASSSKSSGLESSASGTGTVLSSKAALHYLAKRRAEKQRKQKKDSADEIPTFLF